MQNVNNLIPIAAFETWENGGTQISRLVIGEEEVSRFIEDSKDSFARLHVFTDLEEARNEYDMYWNEVYGAQDSGYWYIDANGNKSHTWDYEEACGE
jgi:hypothetical protein